MCIFAAMLQQIYYPFKKFNFSNSTCFLTGQALKSGDEKIQVFPQWLIDRYSLAGRPFKMLDENRANYEDIKVPCANDLRDEFFEPLEKEVAEAFTSGYSAVKELDGLKLFQWAGNCFTASSLTKYRQASGCS